MAAVVWREVDSVSSFAEKRLYSAAEILPMTDSEYLAFISYASRYAAWVDAFHSDLEACLRHVGAAPSQVWLDQKDVGSGRSWVGQLQEGIAKAQQLILVITPEAMASPRVGEEWQAFFAQHPDCRLHLVELVTTPLPPFLESRRPLSFAQPTVEGYRENLRKLVGGLLGKTPREAGTLSLPPNLTGPAQPESSLPPEVRARLLACLAPCLQSGLKRKALCLTLGLDPSAYKSYSTPELAASALLVELTGTKSPTEGALDLVHRLLEDSALEEDEPELREALEAVESALAVREAADPQQALLAVYLAQVVGDHESLVPYIQEKARFDLLDPVYVRLSVRQNESAAPAPRWTDGEAADRPLATLEPQSLEALLNRHSTRTAQSAPRWVILGDPGGGKTTLIRHLAGQLAGDTDRRWIPLFDSLPHVVQDNSFFLKRIADRLGPMGYPPEALQALLEQAAGEGRLLVLLDALDEVSETDRERAEKLLRDLAHRWPRSPIVVTSRPIGYHGPGAGFEELDLLPLDEPLRREFLTGWFGRRETTDKSPDPEAALGVLRDDPVLWELSGNPLYLTLMALLFEEGKPPGRRRTALYDQVFDLLLNGRHRPKPRRMEHQSAVQNLLRYLASSLTEDNVDRASQGALVARLYRPDAQDRRSELEQDPHWQKGMDTFLEEIADRTSILGPHDGTTRDWRFWHRTFREALAAEELESRWRSGGSEAILCHARDIEGDESRWAEPYALLAGRVDDPDALVRALVTEVPALGLRALATTQGLREETIAEILDLTSENIEERGKVILRIPELVGEADRACALIDRLRRGTRDGNDLYFLYEALEEVERLHPSSARRAQDSRDGFFAHVPAPEPDLFRWIDTPKDGRVPLWREIPAGEFWMGSPEGEGEDWERPRHRVKVLSSFAMGSVPVTNAQYAAFDSAKAPRAWKGVGEQELTFHPRVNVSWYEAVSFCRWLSEHGQGARLPTEAEWEYACRASTESRYWSGDEEADLARVGWYTKNSENRTHQVGELEASPWGLYDMHGNVDEWTLSPWASDYSGREAGVEIDLQAPAEPAPRGELRVIRGGSFWNSADWARAAFRFFRVPRFRVGDLGFRVVLPAVPEP